MNLYLHIHETHSRVIFFTWCILTCYYRKTAALQINGHQLIERTQKKITHPVNTITHCLYTFVPLQHWNNDASHWLASFHCPLIPNCTHFLFVSQINRRSPAQKKKQKEEDLWPARRKKSLRAATYCYMKGAKNPQCMHVSNETSLCSDGCTESKRDVQQKWFPQKSEESFISVSISYWVPRSEVSATVLHRCHGLFQLTAAKGDGKPSLAR